MKKAKIVIVDNEDGEGWFIARVDYVTEENPDTGKGEFIEGKDVGIEQGKSIKIS